MLTLNKNRIAICRVIEASPEAVWDIIIDTRIWPTWGPSLLKVDCNDRYIKQGSKGRVKTVFLFWLSFTITEFREFEFWSWRVGRLQATGHRLIRNGDSSCKLCFDMGLWAFAYIPICWLALHKIEKIAVHNGKQQERKI